MACPNCSQLLGQCNAMCCDQTTPIPVSTWRSRQSDIQRPLTNAVPLDRNYVMVLTGDRRCVFLKSDLSCAIYPESGETDSRSSECQNYGNESHILMTCPFQSASGGVRKRWDRRDILRKVTDEGHRVLSHMMTQSRVGHARVEK